MWPAHFNKHSAANRSTTHVHTISHIAHIINTLRVPVSTFCRRGAYLYSANIDRASAMLAAIGHAPNEPFPAVGAQIVAPFGINTAQINASCIHHTRDGPHYH